jgi:hypothetical protein
VMDGMNLAVEIGIGVEGPVPPVLPCVHDKAAGGSAGHEHEHEHEHDEQTGECETREHG